MKTLDEFFERTRDYHILVVGDLMLDRYLKGSVDRISPEAPVPILQLSGSEDRLGGAANVALNIVCLGARASIMGVTGTDPAGATILRILKQEGIDSTFVRARDSAKTTVKTRVLGGHQHLLRIDEEQYREASRTEAVEYRKLLDAMDPADKPHAIILQDYNKGFLSSPMIRMLMHYAHTQGIPVAVDPKEENFMEYQGADIFKPNLRELRSQTPFPVEITEKSLRRAAAHMLEDLQCRLAAITLSDRGIYLAREKESRLFSTLPRTVVDVCGAGDAVIAVLTLALLIDADLSQLAALANSAGGIVCSQAGVCPVDLQAMQAELGSDHIFTHIPA